MHKTLLQGFIPAPLLSNEVSWFYNSLGIDDTYFLTTPPTLIADHILALYGAKIQAFTKHDPSTLVIDLEKLDPASDGTIESATWIHTSVPGVTSTEGPGASCEAK